MKNSLYTNDRTRVTRWLYAAMFIFLFTPMVVSGVAALLHRPSPFPVWLNYIIQSIGWFCWGIASLVVVIARHHHEPRATIHTQPRFWLGLIGFTFIPNGITLGMEDSHMLSEGFVSTIILLISVIATLICLIAALYFWIRSQRQGTRNI
ncbi:hypothetical protein [Dictyobacter halimunensis]|uniref:hypothetical protein n=1 Tax=Dictyobacter halimunensis TaxID=3026934 RepID=UPI0030C6696F